MTTTAEQRARTLRRRTLCSKVTDQQYAAFEALAWARNQTVSDWVRDTLVAGATHESAEHTLLAELLALRRILLNLHFAVATGEPITRDLMGRLIDEADADKGQKAAARLQGTSP